MSSMIRNIGEAQVAEAPPLEQTQKLQPVGGEKAMAAPYKYIPLDSHAWSRGTSGLSCELARLAWAYSAGRHGCARLYCLSYCAG